MHLRQGNGAITVNRKPIETYFPSDMLKMIVRELGLSALAFTLDNGFITSQSKENIAKVADCLDVDHLFFKPSRAFLA